MRRVAFAFRLASLLLLLQMPVFVAAQQTTSLAPVENFVLKDIHGASRSLEESISGAKGLVIAFIGWECPLARLYTPRLNEMEEQFRERGIRWLAINSNQQDSIAELQAFARRNHVSMPLLKDPGNHVADLLGASRTPEVVLLDANRNIVYRGRIDDQYAPGVQRPAPVERYLVDAIESLLDGEPVRVAATEPAGCLIGRSTTPDGETARAGVTWCNQIVRIMQDHCIQCHRAGEIGPFALDSAEEAAGWAGMIREVVNEGRMPPWHANPEHGTFRNDCRLTQSEIDLINAWVEAGAPKGDEAELPEPPVFATGWQMGEPDQVFPMADKPFPVKATGTMEYQYFQVKTGFTTDKWVCAAECRPGNREVIHHIIVGIAGEGDFAREGVHDRVQSDWIAAMAPGSPPMVLPEGYAKRIPAGSKLVFQVHYTPNGKATTDLSSVGLRFIEADKVRMEVLTLKAANTRFRIPPNDANHRVQAKFQFEQEGELLSLFPHMHLRGKSFRYIAKLPGREPEILLDVPRYDFNWQNAYELVEPRKMPEGTRIDCIAHFDNSSDNLANPDPEKTVRWGDQTWEEMMIGYFNVAVPRKGD